MSRDWSQGKFRFSSVQYSGQKISDQRETIKMVGMSLFLIALDFGAPHMQGAVERVEQLTSERLKDQNKIIALQEQLLESSLL